VVDQVDRLLGCGVENIVQSCDAAQRETSLGKHGPEKLHFHDGRLQAAAILLDPRAPRVDLKKAKKKKKYEKISVCFCATM